MTSIKSFLIPLICEVKVYIQTYIYIYLCLHKHISKVIVKLLNIYKLFNILHIKKCVTFELVHLMTQ